MVYRFQPRIECHKGKLCINRVHSRPWALEHCSPSLLRRSGERNISGPAYLFTRLIYSYVASAQVKKNENAKTDRNIYISSCASRPFSQERIIQENGKIILRGARSSVLPQNPEIPLRASSSSMAQSHPIESSLITLLTVWSRGWAFVAWGRIVP